MKHSRHILPVMLVISGLSVSGCAGWSQQMVVALPLLDLGGLGQSTTSRVIEVSGTIEARDVVVVAELGGRVVSVSANEGERVRRGQVLVGLDDSDLALQITQAQAGLKVAQAELAQARAEAKPEEIAAAQSALHQALVQARGSWQQWQDAIQARDNPQELQLRVTEAHTALALTERDVEMAEVELEAAEQSRDREQWASVEYRVAEKGVAAAEELLSVARVTQAGAQAKLTALQAIREKPLILEAKMHIAEAAYRMAQADVVVARTELAAVQSPPQVEDVAIAEAMVHQDEAVLRTLEVMRERMALRAPCDGVVSSRAVEVGEIAAPGAPLLTITDLSEVTLTVYVPETQIGRVELGKEAAIMVDSYPGQGFIGQVAHIADGAEFIPRNVQTKEERANTVFAVKITLANPEQKLRPGMPADALLRE